MTPTTITSRVGADGVLSVTVPLGPAEANREVRVTVESVALPSPMTRDQWKAWVEKMAGSIDDPTFFRHEQGELDERDEL